MPQIGGGGIVSSSAQIADGIIVNADISAAAAIARSKLDFGSGLVDADIAAGAAIAASKTTGLVKTTGDEAVAGVKTFSSAPLLPANAYGAGWNGSLAPATEDAVYDKIQTLASGSTAGVGAIQAGAHVHGQTIQITHGLGRTPSIIRLKGIGPLIGSTSSATPSMSDGIYNGTGNRCVYIPKGASGANADPASSTAFAIEWEDGTSIITGVVQNVGATTFDIECTNTAFYDNVTSNKMFYMWEAS